LPPDTDTNTNQPTSQSVRPSARPVYPPGEAPDPIAAASLESSGIVSATNSLVIYKVKILLLYFRFRNPFRLVSMRCCHAKNQAWNRKKADCGKGTVPEFPAKKK
jgi:hypothetical protein